MKVYRFMSDRYKVAVHAPTLAKARAYVKGHATSSLTHRELKYVGEGHPPDAPNWVGAIVRS